MKEVKEKANEITKRSSCMSCLHCKVMQGKLSQPMSFICAKGNFGLTTFQSELKEHQNCTMFLSELNQKQITKRTQ